MAEKIRNCGYPHCRCESKVIPIGTEVFVSGRYYHAECAKDCLNIREIKKEYFDNISNTVVQGVLGKVINTIIFDKKVDSDYFLFSIKYAIKNKKKVSSPFGLHYLIDDRKIKDEWSRLNATKIKNDMMKTEFVSDEDEVSFSNNSTELNGFGNILRGGG